MCKTNTDRLDAPGACRTKPDSHPRHPTDTMPATVMTHSRALEHSLNNYLAIILGFAELMLQDTAPDDPRRHDLEEIHRAATAAIALVSAKGAGET